MRKAHISQCFHDILLGNKQRSGSAQHSISGKEMGLRYSLLWHPGRLPAPAIDFSNMIDNSQCLSGPWLRVMLRTFLTVYEPYEPIVQLHGLAGSANAGFVPPSHCFLLQSTARSHTAAAEAHFLWQFPNTFPQQRDITGLPDSLKRFCR